MFIKVLVLLLQVVASSCLFNLLFFLQVLANVFSTPPGAALMVKLRHIIFVEIGNFLPTENKNAQVGLKIF
jgi:hypothetical protein